MRALGAVGLTTREACGDTVRNVMACHLAGACPYEFLDVTPWAEAAFEHFVRNPLSQRLPRKFKINFSGCSTDCGQAMFNDVGVIAATRTLDDGSTETGFRVYIAGGLGANPHPALALEEFTSREDLLPTIEAVLRVFDQTGNRDNKLRARLKWVVDQLGIDELRRRVLKVRHTLPASSSWPGGIPAIVQKAGDAPAGRSSTVEATPVGQGVSVALTPRDPYQKWVATSVVRGSANGAVSAVAYAALGDVTAPQFRALASIQRELGADVRLSNRQNVVFRGLTEAQLPVLYARLEAIEMARPGAELARDVVACPGADTCNIAVTQSRGLAKAIGEKLEEEGLAEVGGVRINISGCTNSCGQHHASDIGFFGAERRAHGRVGTRLPDAARWLHRPGASPLRREGTAAPCEGGSRGGRAGDPSLRRRALGRRDLPWLDGSIGRSDSDRRRPEGSRLLPVTRRGARVLRRLRRDRPVRGRNWRVGVRDLSPRYDAAVEAIDAANAADPTSVEVRGERVPLALVHGRLAAEWVEQLVEDLDELLLLAARAHHLRRWELSRDSYPAGPCGLPAVAEGSEGSTRQGRRRHPGAVRLQPGGDRTGAAADPA